MALRERAARISPAAAYGAAAAGHWEAGVRARPASVQQEQQIQACAASSHLWSSLMYSQVHAADSCVLRDKSLLVAKGQGVGRGPIGRTCVAEHCLVGDWLG